MLWNWGVCTEKEPAHVKKKGIEKRNLSDNMISSEHVDVIHTALAPEILFLITHCDKSLHRQGPQINLRKDY